MIILRLCKTALVAAASLFFLFVAIDNTTDYGSNFTYVRHVLSMDDTFKGNREMWRALPYPLVHHLFYVSIISCESICGLTLAFATLRLFQARGNAVRFYNAKLIATGGLTLGLLLWFVAFITIGGEWFLMWQSPTWNGQSAAFRMFTLDSVVLLFLWQPEERAPGA